MSEINAGCVTFDSPPLLQALQVQPVEKKNPSSTKRNLTGKKRDETYHHPVGCTLEGCTTQTSVGYSPPNTPVSSQLPAHDHPKYAAYMSPGQAACLGCFADTNRCPRPLRKQYQVRYHLRDRRGRCSRYRIRQRRLTELVWREQRLCSNQR